MPERGVQSGRTLYRLSAGVQQVRLDLVSAGLSLGLRLLASCLWLCVCLRCFPMLPGCCAALCEPCPCPGTSEGLASPCGTPELLRGFPFWPSGPRALLMRAVPLPSGRFLLLLAQAGSLAQSAPHAHLRIFALGQSGSRLQVGHTARHTVSFPSTDWKGAALCWGASATLSPTPNPLLAVLVLC